MKKSRLKILSYILSVATVCGAICCGNGDLDVSAKEHKISTAAAVGIGISGGVVLLGVGALICYGLTHNNSSKTEQQIEQPKIDKSNKPITNGVATQQDKFYDRAEPMHILALNINSPINTKDIDIEIVESGENKKISGITDDNFLQSISKDKTVGIIDAANVGGIGGGGVDGAIFRSMGSAVAQKWISDNVPEYKKGVRIHEGGAVLHSGFGITDRHKNVPFVIQAVSPILNDENDLKLLYSAYYNAVKLGLDHGCEIFVSPALGMGIFCNNRTKEFGIKCGKVAVQAIVKAQNDAHKRAKIIFTDHNDDRRNEATGAFFQELHALGAKHVQ